MMLGALRYIFLKLASRFTCSGFSFLNISVVPLIKSEFSTTLTAHVCWFIALGAWIPHLAITASFSCSTGLSRYLRTERRAMIVWITLLVNSPFVNSNAKGKPPWVNTPFNLPSSFNFPAYTAFKASILIFTESAER